MRELEILRASLRFSSVSLQMLSSGLADVANAEPQTVQGIARKESLELLQRLIAQAVDVAAWALSETAQPVKQETHTEH